MDKEGREAPGSRGYKYFGAAKDLPGVKELFEQEGKLYWFFKYFLNMNINECLYYNEVAPTRKNRAELMREIDADYYGYLDDEDYLLIRQEERCENAGNHFGHFFKIKPGITDSKTYMNSFKPMICWS